MTEITQKKGMSKGCLVGLIVAGILLVMVIVAAVVLWMNKDDVVKFGATAAVSMIQKQVTETPPDGIDVAAFAAVCNAFNERIKAEPLDVDKLTPLINQIQTIPTDSKVDSAEAVMFLEAIFDYYPELEELYQPVPAPEDMLETEPAGAEE